MTTPCMIPTEFWDALSANDNDARQDRARIECELLDAMTPEERPIVLAALLRLEATTAVQYFQSVQSIRLIAQHAHETGRAEGEQTATAAMLTTAPVLTN